MQVDLTVKNYRCFADSAPLRLSIRDGFTALVGANNAGKSTALRLLYELRALCGLLASNAPSTPVVDNIAQSLRDKSSFATLSSSTNYGDIFCDLNDRELEIGFDLTQVDGVPQRQDVPNPRSLSVHVARNLDWKSTLTLDNGVLSKPDSASVSRTGFELMVPGRTITDLTPLNQAFGILGDTLYVGSFRNALNLTSNAIYYDINVGQAFVTQWSSWKSGAMKGQRVVARQVIKDIQRIFGFRSLDIDASDDGNTLVIDIDDRSYMLSELGSGLTQFIIVLAHAAMRSPHFILIDEPEMNLHPALQLDFLTTLGTYAKTGVIFATHSIGLARAVGNQVYSFQRQDDGSCTGQPYAKTPHLSEFLGELGFSGYQELAFDKVLLVEGVTEVPTIQQLLRLYGKDHTVVIVPMGGTQIISKNAAIPLEELKCITPHVSALIDSERTVENAPLSKSRSEFVDACEKAGVECHVLHYRALENYLSDAAIKRAVGEKFRALASFEHLDSSTNWGKGNNWKIAMQMTSDDLAGTDLGDFLAAL